ncbi:MAG: ribonuclease HI family protein [Pseudomonadota bacterium]
MNKIIIYCDGAARGNPGPAAAGAILLDEKKQVVAEISKYLGETTNNQAEYQALGLALEEAKKQKASNVIIFADSELMVKQIKGEYRVKNHGLKPLFQTLITQLRSFESFSINHIPREKNKQADALANRALDERVL